ncbi:hypothetical protein IH980_00240 [Patescibacteria group bacterium]|nr:hypothetical protein [Patescibacteria group bacterium]
MNRDFLNYARVLAHAAEFAREVRGEFEEMLTGELSDSQRQQVEINLEWTKTLASYAEKKALGDPLTEEEEAFGHFLLGESDGQLAD